MRKLLLASLVALLLVGAAGCALRPAPSSTTTTVVTSPSTTASAVSSSSSTSTTANSTTTTLEGHVAELSGQSEVPALTTSAAGFVRLTVDPEGTALNYVVLVDNIREVTLVKIREGKAGTTGAALAILYAGPTKSGPFSGVLVRGSLGASDLLGPLKGKTISDFLALIRAGQVYVNVGTTKHPNGEIRGQLH